MIHIRQIDTIVSLMSPYLSKANQTRLVNVLETVLEPTHLNKSNDEVITQYLDHCRYLEQTENTIKRISIALNHLSKNLRCDILEADYTDLRDYFRKYKEERQVKARTLNTVIAYVSGLYSYLYTEEWISKNPMLRIERIREPKEKKSAFDESAINQLRSVITEPRDRAILEFLLSTGCRRSELVHIKVSDVNFNDRVAFIKCGKGRKDRVVLFDKTTEKYLKKYLSLRDLTEESYLITALKKNGDYSEKPLSPGSISRIFINYGKEYNIENCHPHTCRHYCITKLIRNGMQPELVAKQAGHSSVAMTLDVYTDVLQEDVVKAYNNIMKS